MGFWPFGGRERADVESASRIVTAPTRGYAVRGKLTLYFKEPQTQASADRAAERCVQIAEGLLREIADHEQLRGREAELASAIAARAPQGAAALRAVELTSLHALVDRGSSPRRSAPALASPLGAEAARGGAGARGSASDLSLAGAGRTTGAPPASPRAGAYGAQVSGALPGVAQRAPETCAPPPLSVRSPPSSGAGRLRGAGAGNARASSPSLVGSPPAVVATALAPLLRDAATRLLLGCLRAHDLIIVRRVAIDAGATEQLVALVPVSEAPPGELEASRAAELSRWHTALGSAVLSQLRTESCAISAQKARAALRTAQITPGVAAEMVDALCRTAFPGLALSSAQIARYADHDLGEQAAESVARVLRHPNSKQLRVALGPLLEAVERDVAAISRITKTSLGGAP
ncbi:hypothetical protein WMF31_09255 [Sorangium sp. So ce1036]|uniref:hypothetical protein n=1 Tax=Sorangium sp. So ce1036 TaxID=3133328 RepID=UPI003EFDCE3E